MQDTIICPICKTLNSSNACCCVSCGQRFKAIEVNTKNIKAIQPIKERKSKGKFHYVFVFLVICLLAYFCFSKQINSSIVSVLPEKVTSVDTIGRTVNEDVVVTLPSKVDATMKFGPKKLVNVQWSPEKIDTSSVGNKIATGKVDGYDGKVQFIVNVLPASVINNIEDCTVNNSMIELDFTVPSSSKWIWINIKKGMDTKDVTIPVSNGKINKKIYLPFNSGEYEINLKRSSNEDKKQGYYPWGNFKVNNTDNRDMKFLLPDEYVESDSAEIIELASKIVSGLSNDSEKTLAIHDYIASNISYDAEAFFNNSLHEYSAIETVEGKKAICNGYANLTAALNRAVGIKTKIVDGTAWNARNQDPQKHAWNETYIDGKWIIQDTTWDAGYVEESTKKFKFKLSHKYFDPSSSDFGKDHHKDKEW